MGWHLEVALGLVGCHRVGQGITGFRLGGIPVVCGETRVGWFEVR